jgi:hypothetical protein
MGNTLPKMAAEVSHIVAFLYTVFTNWILLAGGVVMTAIGIWERLRRKEVHWKSYAWVLLCLLFVAFYMSWRDMRLALDAKPPMLAEIDVNERDPKARADVQSLQGENRKLTKELNDARSKIKALDPLSQSIASASAEITIEVASEKSVDGFSNGGVGGVTFVENRAFVLVAVGKQITTLKSEQKGRARYSMECSSSAEYPLAGKQVRNLLAAQHIQVEVMATYIPDKAEVFGGTVD